MTSPTPGPEQPVKEPEPAARPTRGLPRQLFTMIAVILSVLALVTSCGSLVVAWSATKNASDAIELAKANQPGSVTAAPTGGSRSVPTEVQTTAAGPAPSEVPNATSPPNLDVNTVYSVKYAKQTLRLTAQCNYNMYADLDEPRSNVASDGADLRFDRGCSSSDPSVFRLGTDVDGSTSASSTTTPQECSDKIRTAPVGGASIPVRQGLSFCLTTSYAAARGRGDVWRVVLLTVTGVSDDGAVTIEASAWNVPN